jgi:cell division septation protein DedD
MSQNNSVESSTRSLPNQLINPALQAALSCLDVQLEEELARYRRQRAGQPVMSARGLRRHQTRKSLDLISIEKPRGQTQQRALGMSTAPVMSFPFTRVNQTPVAEPSNETTEESMDHMDQLDVRSSAASEFGNALVSPSSTHSSAGNSRSEQRFREPITSPRQPAEMGSDLVPFATDQAPPEDYLESSEKLLQSLSEEEASVQSQKRSTNKLLTPLGVGSILLLLLSSVTLVYILTNRSTFTALGLDRWFGSTASNKAPSPTQTTVATSEPTKDTPVLNGPNLASDEFQDLNLNTLSHLKASPTPSASPSPVPPLPDLPKSGVTSVAPPVVPNTALPRRSSNLSSALLPPSVQPGTVPSAVAPLIVPTQAPASASAQAGNSNSQARGSQKSSSTSATSAETKEQAATTASGERKFYYVLVNDSSDRALEQAKKIVPDAYVESFPQGAQIQMGAFKTESEANTLVKELQQQGISATIYRP